jgi:hypothetical protein
MEEEQSTLTENRNMITPGGYRFVIIWAVCLLVLYAVVSSLGVTLLSRYAREASNIREARIKSPTMQLKAPAPDQQIRSGARPVEVLAGGSINRIGEFALKESAWTADFNLWFKWNGDAVKPGEGFRIANGQIQQREKVDSYQSGTEHYEEYNIVARVTKDYDASRYPFGEEGLYILVEDSTHGAEPVRYVANKQASLIGPEALPRAVKLSGFMVDTKIATSGHGLANPGPSGSKNEVRSQLMLGLLVVPRSMGLYQKMFQALFASVIVALIALFIKPVHIDCRFGLPVGGFFASVSNNIFVGTLLPNADRLTLTDMVNSISLVTIFLVLAQSVISLYIYDTMGRERLAIYFDRVSFVVFLIGYVAANLALPFAAMPA